MSSDIPLEIASTLQTASIQSRPDPRHDLNPSTAASKREPVTVAPYTSSTSNTTTTTTTTPKSKTTPPQHRPVSKALNPDQNFDASNLDDDGIDEEEYDNVEGVGRPDGDQGTIPMSAIQPVGRRKTMPPLPDLRFEQNYLKSIEGIVSWQGVAWVTFRDQLFLPLLQGAGWTLAVAGWRYWNQATQFQGRSVGARIRRWWWGVNKWKIP